MVNRIFNDTKFWRKFIRYFLVGCSAFILFYTGQTGFFSSAQDAQAIQACTEQPRQYNQCGAPAGSCSNISGAIDSSHTVSVNESISAAPACTASFSCSDQGVKPGECGNLAITTTTPEVTTTACTEQPRQYNQCGAPAGSCANISGAVDFSHTVVVAKNVDSACNVSFLCTDLGVRPGECNNPPTTTSTPAPAQPVTTQQTTSTGTCFLCDNGVWRQAGGNPMTADQCAQNANSAFNQPTAPSWCVVPAAAATTAPAASAAPVQQQQEQQQTVSADNTQVAGTGNSSSATGGSSSATGGSSTGGSSSSTSSATGGAGGGGGSSTVTISETTTTPARTVVVVPAAATSTTTPSVVTVAAAPATSTLPKTGLPALAWAISAFIPAGFKMKRFGKSLYKTGSQGPAYISDKRTFNKV